MEASFFSHHTNILNNELPEHARFTLLTQQLPVLSYLLFLEQKMLYKLLFIY